MQPLRGLTRNPEERSQGRFNRAWNINSQPSLFSVSLLDDRGVEKRDTGESDDSPKTSTSIGEHLVQPLRS